MAHPKPYQSPLCRNTFGKGESIIAKEFGTIASDDFLEVLTNEWFYLVNQKGIPLTTEDQTECLATFLAKTKQPQAGKSPQKTIII